jgi:hypothetical protein
MTGGVGLSVRESGRGRARAERAALLGRTAGPSTSARARASARAREPLDWAGPEGEKKIGPSSIFVFLFQNYE